MSDTRQHYGAAVAMNALKDAEIARLTRELALARDGWYQANGVADLAMKHRDMAEQVYAALGAADQPKVPR